MFISASNATIHSQNKAESVIPAEPVYDEDQALQVPLLAQLKLP